MSDAHPPPPSQKTLSARWWSYEYDSAGKSGVRCHLCPHGCRLHGTTSGLCGVRFCTETGLVSPYLGRFSSIAVDPIEKKPLYHWKPGTHILSLGSVGCTMRCPFCQNHTIAQPSGPVPLTEVSIDSLKETVQRLGLNSVAYTYNEPALQAEYILAAAPLLKDIGVDTVLVTNGMFSQELLADLSPWVAAANVDIKTFNAKIYARLGGSLEAVKRTVEGLVSKGTHVEVTTLVVPGISDAAEDVEEMSRWLSSISLDIPLHLSRYFPAYTYTAPATEMSVLETLAAHASRYLKHVYLGNIHVKQRTSTEK